MKRLILAFSLLFTFGYCAKAQCGLPYRPLTDFDSDTTAFMLYNFMDRADCYKGKTVADVIAEQGMPVKNFAYRRHGIDLVGIDLSVFPTIFIGNENKDFNSLHIALETPIHRDKEYPIMQGKDGWNEQMYYYYKNEKVKSVFVDIPKESRFYEAYKNQMEENPNISIFFFNNGELTISLIVR
jgi:hypothetical protein